MASDQKRNIVIIGGGIIGCTTAYYLTRHPKFNPDLHKITLLEASSIAAGASGKAGGLLALWAYPECLVPLSYRLHGELAREHGGAERWGYRRVGCGSLHAVVTEQALRAQDLKRSQAAVGNGSVPKAALSAPNTEQEGHDRQWEKLPKQDEKAAGLLRDSRLPADLDWIQGDLVDHYAEMGSPGATETSQVHPYQFTTSIAELAREGGVEIRLKARVTKINHSRTAVTSVEYEDGETGNSRILDDLTDVIVAAGPWTGRVLPKTKIEGLRVHSVVYEVDLSPYAVFTEIELPNEYSPEHRARKGQRRKHRGNVDPEVYARPGNEAYACGEPDISAPLPETVDDVECDIDQCDDLIAYMGTVSPVLSTAPVKTKQACYIPRHVRFGEERSPLVGRTVVPGLWVASGHTCWGIQNGPATGYLMAEYLFDGAATSADVEKLDPRKYKV